MPETFVPLVSPSSAPRAGTFSSLNRAVLAPPVSQPAFESGKISPAESAHPSETCSKPTVTLQRTGDVVSSIRVECGCGQVVELSCVY